MRLLGNRVLVRLCDPAQPSVIITPESSRSLPAFGLVLQLGTGVTEPIKVNDLVQVDNAYGSVPYPKNETFQRIYSVRDLQLVLG